jgi:hypothetical protein
VKRPVANRAVVLVSLLASLSFVLAACGDEGISEAELERQRSDAAQNARQEAEIEELREELRAQKQRDSSAPSQAATGAVAPAPATTAAGSIPADARYCGSAYGAGSASCPFVENVSDDYYANGQSSSFESYSPTTGLTYTVTCNGFDPAVCTAGRAAVIYIP